MTHAELVELAAEWLRKRGCAVVITEMSSQAVETPDAIGFWCRLPSRYVGGDDVWGGYGSVLIECKASRPDFLADCKKWFRRMSDHGMGKFRYFLAPASLIAPKELPPCWGLLEAKDGQINVRVKAQPQENSPQHESYLLASCLRRIGGAIPEGAGVSVKFYTYTTKNTATLGVAVEAQA